MKIYKIPQTIQTLIFDIDSTLYTNSAYAYEQVDCQVREFAKLKNLTSDEARKLVFDFRKKFAEENGGKKISLGNLLTNFGIPIEQSVKWRNDLMRPEDFLVRDEKLIYELQILSKKYKLICVTNNPVKPARKTLEVIGISDFFEHIVGLDTCYKSKPAREPFEKALELTKTAAENAVAIGDRYDLDVQLPLQMGMGGIEVSGVEDVYDLNKILG
jgi:phosphoglycolate phosphatase/putative hydrolase of the HAD superfamily